MMVYKGQEQACKVPVCMELGDKVPVCKELGGKVQVRMELGGMVQERMELGGMVQVHKLVYRELVGKVLACILEHVLLPRR